MEEPEDIKAIISKKSESLIENQGCGYEGCDGHIPADGYKCDTCGKAPMGGRRPGAGFPQGVHKAKTLEKMKIKKAFDQRIMQHADRLFNAQLNLAVGEQVLMVRTESGEGKKRKVTHEQITDATTIKRFLDESDGHPSSLGEEENWYYLTTKPANNQAIDSLLNRGLGKPTEKIEIEGGFFKADKLIIEVANERPVEPEAEIIEIEPETEAST